MVVTSLSRSIIFPVGFTDSKTNPWSASDLNLLAYKEPDSPQPTTDPYRLGDFRGPNSR